MIEIHALPALVDNYIYALVEGAQCAVIDPGEAGPVLTFLNQRGLHLSHILCTHHHHDHVGGIAQIMKAAIAPLPEVWSSVVDQSRIAGATRGVHEGEKLELWGHRLEILELPGHTLGQIAFYVPDKSALFAGDTLFSCGCGRLFEGTPAQMFASLAKIKALPADTLLYFGHEYTLMNIDFNLQTFGPNPALINHRSASVQRLKIEGRTTPGTLAQELRVNPSLKAATVAEFRQWREARNEWVRPQP